MASNPYDAYHRLTARLQRVSLETYSDSIQNCHIVIRRNGSNYTIREITIQEIGQPAITLDWEKDGF